MPTTATDLRRLLRGPSIASSGSISILKEAISNPDEAVSTALALDWPELEEVLPDRGLPRGVTELAASYALGGATTVALAAVRAAQNRDRRAWCAWLDPDATLYAPGVVAAGLELDRLLVARPHRGELSRIAVKLATSGAFEVIVIDVGTVPGSSARMGEKTASKSPRGRWPMEVLVRKLALLAEEHGASILLLSDTTAPRSLPWPVALRLELARISEDAMTIRVAKERRGRVGGVCTIGPPASPHTREQPPRDARP